MDADDEQRLARRLKDAFAVLGEADLTEEERATLHRRLIAISDAAKHDTTRALERLDRWFADLEAR